MKLLRRLWPRAVVLVYHRVSETQDDPYGQAVRPETFARHLEILAREHPIVPLRDLIGRRYEDGAVAITFDDGYVDNLSEAMPIAAKVPITVFVTVDPVLDGGRFWWDEIAGIEPGLRGKLHSRLKGLPGRERRGRIAALAWKDDSDRGRPLILDELRDLASRPGVEIGAHTLSHPSLALLPAVEQERELAGAKARLEEVLGRPVTLLAYPFGKPGDVSEETEDLARRAGYRAAFTTVPRRLVPSSPLFALPRLTVHEWPAETLAQRVRELINP
ncbi:MAG TPA: polysaccharide deacetylase family protein [Thermoanaerobaculia bacterium]|nr:polysaccharide deacetylase family protein [Thermoanaerobaculia bacterium]